MIIHPETMTTHPVEPKFHVANAMDRVLRGERSAVEAYDQVLGKITDDPEAKRLESLREFHRQQVIYWESQVADKQVQPSESSGPWGTVVEAFVGTAKLFGNTTALKALKEGEEHGLSEYQWLLTHDYIDEAEKHRIKTHVVPQIELNINSINAMMELQ